MTPRFSIGLLTLALLLAGRPVAADDIPVEVSGLHLCCGGCTSAVEKALSGCEGVTAVKVEQDQGLAAFQAGSGAARDAALQAIAQAGFAGKVRAGGQEAPFPMEKIDDDAASHRVVFKNVHLCCKGCVRAVVKAYEDFPAVSAVDCDIKLRTVTLTGDKINLAAARKKLTGAGYYGVIAK